MPLVKVANYFHCALLEWFEVTYSKRISYFCFTAQHKRYWGLDPKWNFCNTYQVGNARLHQLSHLLEQLITMPISLTKSMHFMHASEDNLLCSQTGLFLSAYFIWISGFHANKARTWAFKNCTKCAENTNRQQTDSVWNVLRITDMTGAMSFVCVENV